MVYAELLDWAGDRVPWQRDALRRIALHGVLSSDDLASLRLQIEQTAGFPRDNVPDPVPLAAEHLSHAASNAPKTVLASLGPVRNIDRLATGQPPLRFAVNGVTLVYGPNASGKSGYCRIAKQLCRSVTPIELRSNVYEDETPDKSEVAVAFRVGDDDQPKEERLWLGDQEPPAELSRISVFDSATARVYVDEKRRIEFLPYELDVMNKLGVACRLFDTGFKITLKSLDEAIEVPLPEGYHEGTAVQAAIGSLIQETALADLPSELLLRSLGAWTAEHQAELDWTAQQLGEDPQVLIRLRTEAKQALETVRREISAIEEELADTVIVSIRKKQREAEVKRRAADAAARDLFSDLPISELGSGSWRQMLIYARDFAATAFSDVPPPQLASGGLCVLCQQDLSEGAAARMAAFDDYIVGRATEESITAAQNLTDHHERLLAFRVKGRTEVETLLAGYAALTDACREAVAKIAAFVEEAGERLDTVKGALRENRYESLHDLSPLPDSPAQSIADAVGQLDAQIAELAELERDEGALVDLRARLAELADEKRLSEQLEIIVERRNRLEDRHRLQGCSKQCRSTAITRRITDRRREILTPTLKAALRGELQRLRLTHIPLDLSDHGEGAQSIIEVALDV